ncbi:MAG: ROK family protein [Chloroflexia bacterium]
MNSAVVALDVGGTKLAAGVVSDDGRVIARARRPTPQSADGDEVYNHLLGLTREVIRSAGADWGISAVGLGAGGPMEMSAGRISPLNIPGWRAFPIAARLERDLGLKVHLDNDAKAFALGEHLFGAGRGVGAMLGVVVSTGVGGGIVIGGRLMHGRTGNAGHVGHLVAEPDGPECVCGARGCVEAIASGPSLARIAREGIAAGVESSLSTLPSLSRRRTSQQQRAGRRACPGRVPPSRDSAGCGFTDAAARLDLDLIVVGGGVSLAGEVLFEPLREALAARARLDYLTTLRVEPAGAGPDSSLIGAASLCAEVSPGSQLSVGPELPRNRRVGPSALTSATSRSR